MKLITIIAAISALMVAGCGGSETPVDSSKTASVVDSEKIQRVETPAEFEDAAEQLEPGDSLILANGEWRDFDAVVQATGTKDAPIQIIAETPGEVILTGQSSLRLGGNYLSVSGLVFRDGYTPRSEVISFRVDNDTLAHNSRVTNTVIDNYSNPDRRTRDLWVGMYGTNNTFDFNHLEGKQNAGPTFAVRLNTEESRENNHRIANNYFGPRPVFGSNGGETLRIGTSHHSLTNSNTVVENNYFDRCSGEVEIASNKSGGNIFRGNTFYASRGTLTLRHGNGTLIENNLFDGANAPYTGGVRVINAQQTIRNNYFKNLTGNRFSGALVIMNGVPNSPINRYHQVDGATIENNVFENVAAIELGEGSDAERTAVPINSIFRENFVTGRDGKTPFNLYDDMTGIEFVGNSAASQPPQELKAGFDLGSDTALDVRAENYGVTKEETGVSWYPKPDEASPFGAGRLVNLEPGTDVLSEALSKAQAGDLFVLAPGHYHEAKATLIDVPISVRGDGDTKPELSFERPNLFVLTGDGGLMLENLSVSGAAAPDGKGNSFVSTSDVLGSGNHILSLSNMQFEDFNVNRDFSVVTASKGSFFDSITVSESQFENISGTVFKLNEETDDYGIYNSEYLTIRNSQFADVGGSVAAVYRGGRDESTFGPHVDVTGSSFSNIGKGAAPLLVLHGIQKGSFSKNTVNGALPIALTYTTGLPIFSTSENTIDGSAQDAFANLTDLRNRQ